MVKDNPKKARQQQAFPKAYKDLAPGARLVWLDGEKCKSLIDAGYLQVGQVETERRRLNKKRDEIAAIVPTAARLDEHQRGFPFPPKADNPRCRMRQARHVLVDDESLVLWPAEYLSNGATFDVVCLETEHRGSRFGLTASRGARRADDDARDEPPSATVAAKERMHVMGFILDELPLKTEETAVLKAQISRYLARKEGSRDEYEVREKQRRLSPPTCLA